MDHFGFGAGIIGAARIYAHAARRTGRTRSLVESVSDGDRIVFSNGKEALRVRCLCLERGMDVECVVVDPSNPGGVFERGTPNGRLLFDHSWVEQFYFMAIEAAGLEIDRLQQAASGYGEAHRETRRKAEELARWRVGP